MVEYIDQEINHLSWQESTKSSDITVSNFCGDHIISGSKTGITVWQFKPIDNLGPYDQIPIDDVCSQQTGSSVCRVRLIGNVAFSAMKNGTVSLHELVTEPNDRKYLEPHSMAKDLHSGFKLNDMLFNPQMNSVITCGNNGTISSFNIDHPKEIDSRRVSDSSLKCMDMITPNEVICGTLSGALKHIDLRSKDCIGTFANQNLSSLVCIQRNPNVNHLATGGNDEGSLVLYDLRNPNRALVQISAHSSSITNIKYRPRSANLVYSSSVEGELFRWDLTTEFTYNSAPKQVQSISRVKDPISITTFDVNHLGDMIYAVDIGALFYHKLPEVGS